MTHLIQERDSEYIKDAQTVENVSGILRQESFTKEADQFEQHLALHLEEIEEGDAEAVSLQSMILFARFLVTHNVSSPFIYVNYNGNVGIEWTISDYNKAKNSDPKYWGEGEGLLVLEFLPTELIEFAMLSGPTGEGKSRLKLNGCVPLEDIEDAIRLITSEIFNDDQP